MPSKCLVMMASLVDHFLYHPMAAPQGDWDAQVSCGALDVWLKAADNVELHCWWFPTPGARLATLFLHGNAGNVTHRIDHAAAINSAGSSVLIPDYRGYGKSKGRPTEQGLYRDAEAAYEDLILRGYIPSQIILHGESLGAAVAIDLAARRSCAALILEAPFASLAQMAGILFPIVGPFFAHGFDSKAKIGRVNTRLLIMHGDSDEVIPITQGEMLFRSAKEPKTFWSVARAHHNDLIFVAGSDYGLRLQALYRSLAAT